MKMIKNPDCSKPVRKGAACARLCMGAAVVILGGLGLSASAESSFEVQVLRQKNAMLEQKIATLDQQQKKLMEITGTKDAQSMMARVEAWQAASNQHAEAGQLALEDTAKLRETQRELAECQKVINELLVLAKLQHASSLPSHMRSLMDQLIAEQRKNANGGQKDELQQNLVAAKNVELSELRKQFEASESQLDDVRGQLAAKEIELEELRKEISAAPVAETERTEDRLRALRREQKKLSTSYTQLMLNGQRAEAARVWTRLRAVEEQIKKLDRR